MTAPEQPTGPAPRRRPTRVWLFLGLALAVVLISVPTWLELEGRLEQLPSGLTWMLVLSMAVAGPVSGALMDRLAERRPAAGEVEQRRSSGGNNLPPSIEHFVGYVSERAWIRQLFLRFPPAGWRGAVGARLRSEPHLAPLVVVISGPPGTGKSQLAIRMARQVAERFPDGVRWMDLYGEREEYAAEDLELRRSAAQAEAGAEAAPGWGGWLTRLLRRPSAEGEGEQVGMDGPQLGATAPRTAENLLTELLTWMEERPRTPHRGQMVQAWRDASAGKRLLLVLENADGPEKLRKLLPNSAMSAVIVTTRQAFDDPGVEYETVELSGLFHEEGLELLERLAPMPAGSRAERRRQRDLRSRVVAHCHGLPLALGLCGKLLAQPAGSAPARHQGVTDPEDLLVQLQHADQTPLLHAPLGFPASFTVIFQHCTPEQRLLLRRMAATDTDEASEASAAALLDTSRSRARAVLAELHARFLLERIGRAEDGVVRYRMQHLVRDTLRVLRPADFGLGAEEARTWDSAATGAARERLVRTYAWLAEQAAARLARRDQGFAVAALQPPAGAAIAEPASPEQPQAWLERERAVLLGCVRMAAKDGHLVAGWRLARAVCAMCQVVRTHWAEWEQAAQAQYDLAHAREDPHAVGMALLEIAEFAGSRGDYERGVRCAAEAETLFTGQVSDARWAARARRALGVNLHRRGDLDTARTELSAAEHVFAEHGAAWWLARTRTNLADLHDHLGNHGVAEQMLHAAEETFTEFGDEEQRHLARLRRAEVLAHQGRHLHAWYLLSDVRHSATTRRERWYLARCLRSLGELDSARLDEQYEQIHLALHPARALERRDHTETGYIQHTRRHGHPDSQQRRIEIRRSLEERMQRRVAELLGEYAEPVQTRFASGATRRHHPRRQREEWSPQARTALLHEAIRLMERLGDVWGLHRTQLSLGRVLLRRREEEEGQHLLRQAAAGFESLGDAWWSARAHRLTAQELLDLLRRGHSRDSGSDNAVASTQRDRRLAAAARQHAEQACAAYQDMANHVGQLRAEILLARVLRATGTPADEILERLDDAAAKARDHGHTALAEEASHWRHEFEHNPLTGRDWPID